MGQKTDRNTRDGMRYVRSKGRRGKKVIHRVFKAIKLNKKSTLLILLIVICFLQGVKIQIVNELSIKDYEYAYLLLQIKKQIQENSLLYDEILKDEAFTTIVGEEKGFKPATFIYLKIKEQ